VATLVIHGTMTLAAAQHSKWWWDSWYDGGFLDALSAGMDRAAHWDDVWTVGGTPVSEIPALNTKRDFWRGYFLWSGADMGPARDAGAKQLVDYLNRIADLTDEPLRVVAHSHGCNLVKAASSSRKLRAHIGLAVFLACPHFVAQGHQGPVFTYRLNPKRFGNILNLYSDRDTVQVGLANKVTGIPGPRFADWLPQEGRRCDEDPAAAHLYEDFCMPTSASGTKAHTVMHGSLVGNLAGMWLNSELSFAQIVEGLGVPLPAVPADDVGE
jgi:hypothetical protein